MAVSLDRKILNQHNRFIDDPHDKHLATSAQIKHVAKRRKKALKRAGKADIADQPKD